MLIFELQNCASDSVLRQHRLLAMYTRHCVECTGLHYLPPRAVSCSWGWTGRESRRLTLSRVRLARLHCIPGSSGWWGWPGCVGAGHSYADIRSRQWPTASGYTFQTNVYLVYLFDSAIWHLQTFKSKVYWVWSTHCQTFQTKVYLVQGLDSATCHY